MATYSFGNFQLNTDVIKLFCGDEEVELEPQVFNTLLYLVQNNHRVVTKDELFEEVWHGRSLTDHVITRIIYELRKTLDDKTTNESVVRTVRGKGYQFIVPVSVTDIKLNKSATNTDIAVSHDQAFKRSIVLIIIAVVIVSAWVFYAKNTRLFETDISVVKVQQEQVYQILSVLPIEIQSNNDELAMLVQSLIDYLTYQLKQNFNMKVIHPDSLVSLSDKSNDLYAIQEATRSNFLIQGFMESESDQVIKLHLTLHKLNQDNTLTPFPLGAFEFPFPNNVRELNALYKQRKVTVRSIVEIIRPGLTLNQDDHFKTEDPEAYRLVIAAHHMSRTDGCEDMKRAEELLLKAVARDQKFVYAYLQLFMNYYKRVWVCGESTDYHVKGLAMAAMVDRLAPNKFQAMNMRRSTILVESNKVEEAYEFSKQADWNDPNELYDMSYSLRYAGFLNKSIRNIDRILQLDPFFFSEKPIQHAPNTLLYQNKFDEHLKLLAEPGSSYHDYFRGLNLFFTGKKEQSILILKAVVERTPNDLFGKFSKALLLILEDQPVFAVDAINAIVQQRNSKNHTDGEMTYKLAQLYAMAGDADLALIKLQMAVNQGFFPMNYFLSDPAFETFKNNMKFNKIINLASNRHQEFALRFGLESEAIIK